MRAIVERVLPIFFALLTVVVLIYVLMAEITRREEIARGIARINTFMMVGPRFPLQYGLGLCERIRVLEVNAGRPDPVDCDAIRHAAMTQGEGNGTKTRK